MAIGMHPFQTWDHQPIVDAIRMGLSTGSPLLFSAACCIIKGDWAEFCSTFGFSTWATIAAPCFACWATTGNYLQDATFGADTDV